MLALLISCLLFASQALTQQSMVDVPSALFDDGLWRINVNYIDANSTKMYSQYKLTAPCLTKLEVQEVFCLGKSVNVRILNDNNSTDLRILHVNSTVGYNCSMNMQDPNSAALLPLYAKGQIILPTGNYTIKMNLIDGDTDLILGYRGYAIRASIPVATIALAAQCRADLRQNGPLPLP